jgi:hypothetical protein
MNRKQIVTTLPLGLMGMILLMSAGCDRFNLGMTDNSRDELDPVDPNLVRANTIFGFQLLNELCPKHSRPQLAPTKNIPRPEASRSLFASAEQYCLAVRVEKRAEMPASRRK